MDEPIKLSSLLLARVPDLRSEPVCFRIQFLPHYIKRGNPKSPPYTPSTSLRPMLKAAGRALYEAKEAGHDRDVV